MEKIKKLAKRSQMTINLYSRLRFFSSVPIKDLAQIRKIALFLTVEHYTLLSYARLSKLYELARQLERERIDGSFAECGVWNGGSAGVIAAAIKNNKNRHVWLFDSWEGQPNPTEFDRDCKGKPGKKGMDLGSEEKVRELLFKRLKLDNEMVHLVKGWFNDTIPIHKKDIGKISLLHLDCDWYESVKLCLEELYDEVIKGGYIVIDDYGHWRGCRKAVDEFIESRNLKKDLVKIDYTGVYFQKRSLASAL